VEVLILGSAAVGVAAVAVVLVIAAVPAGRLFLFCSPLDKDFHFPGLGYSSPMIRLAVGLREEWSLAYRVWAGMVWFKALLALD